VCIVTGRVLNLAALGFTIAFSGVFWGVNDCAMQDTLQQSSSWSQIKLCATSMLHTGNGCMTQCRTHMPAGVTFVTPCCAVPCCAVLQAS
jgi:hypothetical protein